MGLPVYNGLPYVQELIESLLAQTFGDFELAISDNASTDGTSELCQQYAAADPRIKYVRNPENIGLIPNFNRVFEISSAPIYKWVAADDLYEPRYLEACFPLIENDPSVAVAHCQTILVDGDGQELPYDACIHGYSDSRNKRSWLLDRDACATRGGRARRFRDVLMQQIMCSPIYGLMPRRMLDKTGLHKSFFGSDKLLLAEMALEGRFAIAPEKLFKKRIHTEMTSVMSGAELQTKIDPEKDLDSLRREKLRSYIAMLRSRGLSRFEYVACLAYLGLHSASSAVPEILRYRPNLLGSHLASKWRQRGAEQQQL